MEEADLLEIIIFFASAYFTIRFLVRFYSSVRNGIRIKRNPFSLWVTALIPVLSFALILFVLTTGASFDVEGFWILFYLIIGFAWVYFGLFLMFYFFDISWADDVINMNNPAAAFAVFGGAMASALIYAGANIGDGPGWWCVFFAGGLGLAAWVFPAVLANFITKAFRRVTVGRNIPCGIRTGAYFLSAGIILARACAGDWTSFSQTVLEFGAGWPVLFLSAAFILTELIFAALERREEAVGKEINWILTALLSVFYIAAAIFVLKILPPLPINPVYPR